MSKIRIRKFYIKDIRHQVGASPIWPVSARFALGDYGYYSRKTGHFSVRGNIFEDLGVPKKGIVQDGGGDKPILYKIFNSSNTTKNNFKVDAEATPNKGSLELAFEGEYSYLFHLFKAEVYHLKLNDTVKQKLAEARDSGKWKYRYRIIEMVYQCPDIRFAFSLSKTAAINLGGSVDTGQLPAKGTINYKMESSSNMDGSFWIEDAYSTPFVHFASFKRRELKFHDTKLLLGEDWHLEKDTSSSFHDEDDLSPSDFE
jgi:hypothetical protein